jgi:hypothetical protein
LGDSTGSAPPRTRSALAAPLRRSRSRPPRSQPTPTAVFARSGCGSRRSLRRRCPPMAGCRSGAVRPRARRCLRGASLHTTGTGPRSTRMTGPVHDRYRTFTGPLPGACLRCWHCSRCRHSHAAAGRRRRASAGPRPAAAVKEAAAAARPARPTGRRAFGRQSRRLAAAGSARAARRWYLGIGEPDRPRTATVRLPRASGDGSRRGTEPGCPSPRRRLLAGGVQLKQYVVRWLFDTVVAIDMHSGPEYFSK